MQIWCRRVKNAINPLIVVTESIRLFSNFPFNWQRVDVLLLFQTSRWVCHLAPFWGKSTDHSRGTDPWPHCTNLFNEKSFSLKSKEFRLVWTRILDWALSREIQLRCHWNRRCHVFSNLRALYYRSNFVYALHLLRNSLCSSDRLNFVTRAACRGRHGNGQSRL